MLQERGFFIEVGALDGERSSNTIWLEHKKHWTGLLIEMDPYFYTMLKGHTRNAWSINCCLSPKNHTTVVSRVIIPSQLVAQWIPDCCCTYVCSVYMYCDSFQLGVVCNECCERIIYKGQPASLHRNLI